MSGSRLVALAGRFFVAAEVAACAFLAAPGAAQTSPAAAIAPRQPDAFYSGLMRDGRTALLRGDAAAAARDLRIACFGFLDFPATLAECRIRLGLAQAALGDKDAFIESFSRLEDLEERFQVYAGAAISPEERAAFEQQALEWVSPEVLRTVPAFAPLVEKKKEADFAKLAPRERMKELERRAAADPKDLRWILLLAEEELARDEPAAALDRLGELADTAGNGAVGCLRGRALAELERSAEAVKALAGCGASSTDPRLADLLLASYLDLDRFDEARIFAAGLPPAVSSRPEIRKRVSRISAPAPPKATAKPEQTSPAKAKPAPPSTAKAKPEQPSPAKAKPEQPSTTKPEPAPAPQPAKAKPRDEKERAAGATPAPAKPGTGTEQSAEPNEPPKPVVSAKPAKPAKRPSAADQSAMADLRKTARTGEKRDELERALARAQPIADRYPAEAEYQHLVGELAYRTAKWKTGADYLARPDVRGPSDPTLRFYLAVCQFESGDTAAAARTAGSGLDKLPRTPLVESYLQKILPEE